MGSWWCRQWGQTAASALIFSLQDEHFFRGSILPSAAIGNFLASDNDAGDILKYEITEPVNSNFTINEDTGAITFEAPNVLDFETQSAYTLKVKVTDAAGLTVTAVATIYVLDENEPPIIVS